MASPGPYDALAARVAAAADALPRRERTALVMRERDGARYFEIAGALRLQPAEVPQLLVDARMAVRGAVRHVGPPPVVTPECPDIRRLLCVKQDGEALSSGETQRVRAHVEECEACRVARRGLREASLACRAWAPAAAGAAVAAIAVGGEQPSRAGDNRPPATAATPVPTPTPTPTPDTAAAAAERRAKARAERRRRARAAAAKRRREAATTTTTPTTSAPVTPAATSAPTRTAPQATSTPRPRRTAAPPRPTATPRPTSTPAPARTPAPTPKPDIVPGGGDTFCPPDDPTCT